MKNLLLAVAVVLVAGCATTVPFRIKSVPPGVTKEQVELDNLTCSNMSKTDGPWMYGIGTAIIRSEAAKRYQKCMSEKGYVVVRGSGGANYPSSTDSTVTPRAGTLMDNAASQAFKRLNPTPPKQPRQAGNAPEREVPAVTPARDSIASKLKELEKLYKEGLITKKEYKQKREQILSTL